MRTFFYSIKRASDCGSGCRWQDCPQRYLARLQKADGLSNIQAIFGEFSYVAAPLDTNPKNGDIIILYAETPQELDSMIAAKDGFDGLKKILVLADSTGVDGGKYHMLAPRFITQAERNIAELENVVRKMRGHLH
jgi:hypothetical protein